MMKIHTFIYILSICVCSHTLVEDEFSRFRINPDSKPMSDIINQPYGLFVESLKDKRLYITGGLQAKFCQTSKISVTGSCYIENELYMKAGLTAKLIASAEHDSGDVVTKILHGAGKENRIRLKSSLQCEGAMKFGSQSVNETIRQVMNEFEQTKSEAPGSMLSPTSLSMPTMPIADSFVEIKSMTIRHRSSNNDNNEVPNPMRQWHLHSHDNFDQGHADGWKWIDNTPVNDHIVHCGDGDYFIAGHCIPNGVATDTQIYQNVTKIFTKLPPHTQLEIQASIHFIDKWIGHVAYLEIDNEIVWLDSHEATTIMNDNVNINICGHKKWTSDRLAVPVTVIVPHTSDNVKISFGSNVEHNEQGVCVATLGIDDVMLWLKSLE